MKKLLIYVSAFFIGNCAVNIYNTHQVMPKSIFYILLIVLELVYIGIMRLWADYIDYKNGLNDEDEDF